MANFIGLLQTIVLPPFGDAIENTLGKNSQFLIDLTSGILFGTGTHLPPYGQILSKRTRSYAKAVACWSKSRQFSANTTELLQAGQYFLAPVFRLSFYSTLLLTICAKIPRAKIPHRSSLLSAVDVSFHWLVPSVMDTIQQTRGKSINDQKNGLKKSRQNCGKNNPDRRSLLVFTEHASSASPRQNIFT